MAKQAKKFKGIVQVEQFFPVRGSKNKFLAIGDTFESESEAAIKKYKSIKKLK